MPAHHSLALPLSAEYTHNARDGFSFFLTSTNQADNDASLHPKVEAYLDDLCGFLRDTRLIQAHPDTYFQLIRGETWPGSSVHFDGSAVETKELQYVQRLLSGFRPLLQGEDAMTKLRTLLRDGPPPCATAPFSLSLSSTPVELTTDDPPQNDEECRFSLQALNEFYSITRRLMLNRVRRPHNDAATLTLLSSNAARRIDRVSASAVIAGAHKDQILDLVVSHGMSPKKKHEVRIMRDTIHDLIDCCNSDVPTQRPNVMTTNVNAEEPSRSEISPPVRVETVVNIGEGKGYVSRAVALCDNVQVIGLDCNPAHKERAVERVEALLETSLSSRDGQPRVNLLYEPRGHVASIACHVGGRVDWTKLLQGHVLTCADPHCGCASMASHDTALSDDQRDTARCGKKVADDAPPSNSQDNTEMNDVYVDATTVLSRTCGEESVKLACRLCGKVARLENTTVVMKHIYTHLRDAKTSGEASSTSSLIPTAAQLHKWNVTLSQYAYVAKLTETFFTVSDLESQHYGKQKDAALLKRPRDRNSTADGDGDRSEKSSLQSYLALPRASCRSSTRGKTLEGEEDHAVTLQPTYTARGYRALLLVARNISVNTTTATDADKKATDAHEKVERKDTTKMNPSPVSPTEQPLQQSWVYEEQMATIVGYDGGADCHQVCLDVENKKRTLRLYRFPPSASGIASPSLRLHIVKPSPTSSSSATFIGEWMLPDPAIWGRERVALVLTVLPPALPSTPAVLVPSVRNTVLIGLHPCGDLGSNVCRIFRNSAARGLLLVSCCWHALTPQGFPLSRAMQRRHMKTDGISLLLATQPLDAWSTASPEGHRSSAKLLFYRSLFKLLWAQLAREWKAERQQCQGHNNSLEGDNDVPVYCEFPEAPPHLEPAFLRRESRRKQTLTFAEFTAAIAAEYLYKETAKNTPYTPWNIGRRCPACREAQEAFIRRALTIRDVPGQLASAFERTHFAQFLGLTVLRMWMCHLVESLLLLDRALYLHEELSSCRDQSKTENGEEEEDSAVSLVPLFDGALSPRMYGVLARRGGSA